MNPALIQMIVTLAPYGVQVIMALIDLLNNALNAGHSPDTLTGVSTAILDGVASDHPDWPTEQVHRYATDAIDCWTARHTPVAPIVKQ